MENYLISEAIGDIADSMVYAYYKKMPDALVYQAMKELPDWMVEVSERFDKTIVFWFASFYFIFFLRVLKKWIIFAMFISSMSTSILTEFHQSIYHFSIK